MFLALDSHDREIADAAADFLGSEFPLERLHARPRDPRRLDKFAGLGWLGLAAPESAGGSGLGVVEAMLFFLALGRVAGPLEALTQILAVEAAGEDAAVAPALVAGERSVALLVEHTVDGAVRLLGAADADYALRVTPEGATLYRFNGGGCRDVPCLDRSVGMLLGDSSMLAPALATAGEACWRLGQVAVSAMQVGLAGRALEMIVEYARERQTFGRPIGAYQAVRHPCADMAVRVEAARSQLYYAATALREGHADAGVQADAARQLAGRAADLNTDANIQLHGGIGVTDEHSAHLLLKRANLLSRLFGGRSLTASLLALDEHGGGEE